jgi:hypothetical protein
MIEIMRDRRRVMRKERMRDTFDYYDEATRDGAAAGVRFVASA